MAVKVKKCELNFKNTREKIVMEVTFQKTNEAVDIRDFLCMAMNDNPRLRVEFSKGEYRVTDKTTTASTNACAILEQLPAILQTFMTFNGQANEGQVPDTNSKQNDIETQRDKEKGNFEDKGHGSNDIEIQTKKEKGNNEGKDQGSETHEEHKKIPKDFEKENFENRSHDSLTDSKIREETKETKVELEATNQPSTSTSTSSSAYTPWKQEDSSSLEAPQREEIETSDNSQTAIRSYEGQPKAKEGMAGVQNDENTSSSVSQGVKIKTDKSKSNRDGESSEQDPKSSRFEDQQGERKAEKPGACSEMDISEATNKPDESIRTSKPDCSQAKERTVPMKTEENVDITKAQTTSGEASEGDKEAAATRTGDTGLSSSGAQQMKGKAEKSGDNKATEQSASATKSHAEASISGTSQVQKGAAVMQNEGNTTSLADTNDRKMPKKDDTRSEEKSSLPKNNPYDSGTFG